MEDPTLCCDRFAVDVHSSIRGFIHPGIDRLLLGISGKPDRLFQRLFIFLHDAVEICFRPSAGLFQAVEIFDSTTVCLVDSLRYQLAQCGRKCICSDAFYRRCFASVDLSSSFYLDI